LVAEIFEKILQKKILSFISWHSESVLLPQQLYVIVAVQLISSSFICDIISNISATKTV